MVCCLETESNMEMYVKLLATPRFEHLANLSRVSTNIQNSKIRLLKVKYQIFNTFLNLKWSSFQGLGSWSDTSHVFHFSYVQIFHFSKPRDDKSLLGDLGKGAKHEKTNTGDVERSSTCETSLGRRWHRQTKRGVTLRSCEEVLTLFKLMLIEFVNQKSIDLCCLHLI